MLEVTPLARATSLIRLMPQDEAPFDFRPGQYASLAFPGQPPRDYSLASRPDEPHIDFHIRQVGETGPSAYAQAALHAGDPVRLEGPFGQAYWREEHDGPMLLIGGGTGLAPMIAIVETALAAGVEAPVHLYAGFQDEPDIYYEDRLRALEARHGNFTATYVLSAPEETTNRRTGFVHLAVAEDHADFAGFKAYMAGAPVMVEAAAAMLVARGMKPADIHADPFYGASDPAAARRA
ncbi:FAD-binding oxidoreductase [Oceanibaculum sp.]|uniref:FAD-binding oxidoreductase n=1 Tax=Oceanibaculum sp. TaxID=1903597 RepID=UPI0025873697|nr:FAD-binding oxidoreductase [Oceanibaculum sp.]MCH2393362.1 FAD-binding oxidoreductase [Oceanibaculum sp.]